VVAVAVKVAVSVGVPSGEVGCVGVGVGVPVEVEVGVLVAVDVTVGPPMTGSVGGGRVSETRGAVGDGRAEAIVGSGGRVACGVPVRKVSVGKTTGVEVAGLLPSGASCTPTSGVAK
jgi:hypothetical protein